MAIAFMVALGQQSRTEVPGKYFSGYFSLDWFDCKVRSMSTGWILMLLVDPVKLGDSLGYYPA